MEFYLSDRNKRMTVEMRTFDGENWSPDFFGEMETGVPREFEREQGGCAYICKSEEFNSIVGWWRDEAECMRNGDVGELADYSDEKADTRIFVKRIC